MEEYRINVRNNEHYAVEQGREYADDRGLQSYPFAGNHVRTDEN